MAAVSHHSIRQSLLERIQRGEWPLGALIPGEVQLAEEYGCARATVNRALQALAHDGLVIRKRRGGTRVSPLPVRQARLEIPILREQVEATGSRYTHQLTARRRTVPPARVRDTLQLPAAVKALYLETMHLADDRPFAFETRWINADAVPELPDRALEQYSVNEWLVRNVPFSSGNVSFSAVSASATVARALETSPNAALFLVERTTWREAQFITTTKLFYRPGYALTSRL